MTEYDNTAPAPKRAYAGLFRRLFSIFYDCFLLLAILFIVSAIATALNQGKAIEPSDRLFPVFSVIIFGLSYLYFAWFWMHGGQTLGMKTWRIKMVSSNEQGISWKTTALRFLTAMFSWGIFGAGFLWALFDKQNRCWHDLSSHTVLLDLRDK